MAPPKKKTGASSKKGRVTVPRYLHRQRGTRPDISRRVQTRRPIDIPELVCRLLNAEKHNQDRYGVSRDWRGRDGSQRNGRKYENRREPSYDTSTERESSMSIDESEYVKSRTPSAENLLSAMDGGNSSLVAPSECSSVSNLSLEPIALADSLDNTRALLKKKSLVQIINNYIKAGIEEGKRQAKKYIRKALSFGVRSGFLIPADPHCQVIRVSSKLADSKKSDTESRRIRRMARQGSDETYIDRKERCRGTARKARRDDSPETVTPRKRRKNAASVNAGLASSVANARGKKNVAHSAKETKKRTTLAKQKSEAIRLNLPTTSKEPVNRKSKQQSNQQNKHKDDVIGRKRNRKRGRRPMLNPSEENTASKSNRDVSDEEEEDSAKSSDNDVNQRSATERRKSVCSQEGVPRDTDESAGNLDQEVEEKLERPCDTENQHNGIENAD